MQSELIGSFEKVKGWNEEHNTPCFYLEKMCNFISESDSTSESQNAEDARALLEKNVKDEKDIYGSVTKWRRENAKWLRKRKRVEKTEVRIGEERVRAQNTDISRANMMEKMSESFKPTTLLADDGNLKAKNEFKIAMEKYYKYNKEIIAQLL